jgi:predicted transcriptional regulator
VQGVRAGAPHRRTPISIVEAAKESQPLHTSHHNTLLEELEARQDQVLQQLQELEERIRRTIEACMAEMASPRGGTASPQVAVVSGAAPAH